MPPPAGTTDIAEQEQLGSSLPRRAPRITRDQVFSAAWELATEGHRPTIERVRMRLGGGVPRGSPNTVNAWLNEWWSQLAQRLRDKPGAALPSLPERVSMTLEALWAEALTVAREAHLATQSEREQSLIARERKVAQQAQDIDEREKALCSRAAALEEALSLAREQLIAANRRAEALEAGDRGRAVEVAALYNQLTTRDSELHRLQELLETERDRLNRRYDAAEARWLNEVDQARQTAKEQAQELKRLAADHRAVHHDRDRLQRELTRVQAGLNTVQSRRDRLTTKLHRAKSSGRKSKPARRTKPASRRSS